MASEHDLPYTKLSVGALGPRYLQLIVLHVLAHKPCHKTDVLYLRGLHIAGLLDIPKMGSSVCNIQLP